MEQVVRCKTCGIGYVSGLKEDDELHDKFHKQWIETARLWGIDPIWSHELYERDKHKYRDIFGYSQRSHHEKVEAAVNYLYVQWKEDLQGCVRFDVYDQFIAKYPDISSWIRDNYRYYQHEFNKDIQSSVCRQYNIKPDQTK